MTIKQWALGAAMAALLASPVTAAIQAGPFLPGTLGVLDDVEATLIGTHVGQPGEFQDFFAFGVTQAHLAVSGVVPGIFGADTPASEYATVLAMALFDSQSNLLALDDTGADGFLVSAVLPTAGVYLLGVFGVTLEGSSGAYGAILRTVPLPAAPIPEPSQWALTLVGLLGMAAVASSRRQSPPSR